jgi:hypothetical protein
MRSANSRLNRKALKANKFNFASSNIGWDFRRKSAFDGTSPFQNNGHVA